MTDQELAELDEQAADAAAERYVAALEDHRWMANAYEDIGCLDEADLWRRFAMRVADFVAGELRATP